MEINVGEKDSDDENLKANIPNTVMTDQKQLENVEYFNYFGSMITNYARYVRVAKFRIARMKAFFKKKTTGFSHQQFGLKFKEENRKMKY